MPALRALYSRFEFLLQEIAKFGVIGVMGFVIDFGLFNLLHHREAIGPLTSNTVSSVVAAVFTYVGNRYWSFRHKVKQPMRKEIPVFFVLNVIGLVITEAFIGFAYYALDTRGPAATNIAKLVGTAVATLFRFATYKRFVFVGEDTRLLTEDDLFEPEAVVQV